MMTGAPKSGVTALRGIMPPSAGNVQSRLQSRANTEPISMVTGSRRRWFSVPMTRRAMCGVARPIKAIGPQKAVTTAVSKPVISNKAMRSFLIENPRFSAYCSPRSMALRGLMSRSAETISPRPSIHCRNFPYPKSYKISRLQPC